MTKDAEPTVLVVDDNRAIADTYAAFLADDYGVGTVYDGESALETLGPETEVVLLDRRMPDLTGDEVLSEIDARGFDCRVVMVTAVDPEFDIVDMPFDAYVVKPVDRDQLNAIVEEMMDRAEYDDEFRRFLALLSKKSTLEARKDGAELAASEEYARVSERIAEKREALGIDTEEIEGIFAGDVPDISPNVD